MGGIATKKAKSIGRIFGIGPVLVLVGAMLPLGTFDSHSQVEASPATIYVPDDYLTIQAAVNASSSGDTIIVRAGTYIENVDVDKDHLTIQSENGVEATIVQAANPGDRVFEVTADYVNVDGFTFKGINWAGIHLEGDHGTVYNTHVATA